MTILLSSETPSARADYIRNTTKEGMYDVRLHSSCSKRSSCCHCQQMEENVPYVMNDVPFLARHGDIVTLEYYELEPENGYVPEPLFDLSGSSVSLVLGWGNYLPGFHEILMGRSVGDIVHDVSIDAGWGDRRNDLLFKVSTEKLHILGFDSSSLKVGSTIHLQGNIPVMVSSISNDGVVELDANHPLAGSSYLCRLKIKNIERFNPDGEDCLIGNGNRNNSSNQYHVATFALGCFWGAELAFMRVRGVVGTRVGYSQGTISHPTYEQVGSGNTRHREVVQVIYDVSQITYEDLVQVALKRLQDTFIPTPSINSLFESDDDSDSYQYRHGIICHSSLQEAVAQRAIIKNSHLRIELLQPQPFWSAEDYHQKYLYKGGQSARIGCREKIRCFG